MDTDVLCQKCGKRQQIMKRCTQCREAYYCSRQCQMEDWTDHKKNCSALKTQYSDPSEMVAKSSTPSKRCGTPNQAKTNEHNIDNSLPPPRKSFTLTTRSGTAKTQVRNNSEFRNSFGLFSLDGTSSSSSKEMLDSVKPVQKFQKLAHHGKELKDETQLPVLDEKLPQTTITVKCNKEKERVAVQGNWDGSETIAFISHSIKIPAQKLRLVHKGKLVTRDNIKEFVKEKALFQAIGEKAESEDGLDSHDIDVLMSQLSVDRNQAIKALRTSGDLVDAMFHITNK